jgi:hypothetical protein
MVGPSLKLISCFTFGGNKSKLLFAEADMQMSFTKSMAFSKDVISLWTASLWC